MVSKNIMSDMSEGSLRFKMIKERNDNNLADMGKCKADWLDPLTEIEDDILGKSKKVLDVCLRMWSQ